jgi:glycosyltransferase involved in cell wall biosynthesis
LSLVTISCFFVRRLGAVIVFVGEGPDLRDVQGYFASQDGIEVRFFPRLPYDQFIQLVSAVDVAAFPYPDNALHRSKCSTRIIDYMAMGRAVLTTAVGQNTEYIVHGESGVLAPPGDEARFREELARLLQDAELRTELGLAAQKRVKEKFSWSGEALDNCLAGYERLSRL